MEKSSKTPVYKKVWFMALISVLFPIVGMFLMWKFKSGWHKVIKIILTVIASIWLLLLLAFCGAMGSDTPTDTTSTAPTPTTTEQQAIEESTTAPTTVEETSNETTEKETETTTEETTTKPTTTKPITTKPTTTKTITEKQTTKATTVKATTTKAPTVRETEDPDSQITVYKTKSGEKYHYENPCGNGKYSPITLSEAKARGLEPCEKCVLH